ncbi:PR5-like receptor kinase isoform X3 [Medicago truncatula]|uniref:PR5-like receptor kinase isoform X3 n=1 Tax=Medicago truncatula TaxID=3880 RepID=UPI000D2F45C8|nr:PR5-like receptor kinase isoform X3 [Medicago truncatula]
MLPISLFCSFKTMLKQLFLLDLVLIFCVLVLASAQSEINVNATYRSFNSPTTKQGIGNKWNLNTAGVLCASQDGNKSLSWRSKYGWAAFCGIWLSKYACGKCLNVTNQDGGNSAVQQKSITPTTQTVRIVDECSNGGLDLDMDVFDLLDTSGDGNAQGYLLVDYEFVDCGDLLASTLPKNFSNSSTTVSPTPAPTPSPTFLSPNPLSNLTQEIHRATTSSHSNWQMKRKVIIGVVSPVMVVLIMCIIIYCLRSKSSIRQGRFRFRTKNDNNIEAFLKDHGALLQKRYKFSEIKKMTNSFKVKLGQGGFGVVYKGKLFNGCHVAIKILNPSKGNGEEFINEVSSISRTSHVNVVTLLGFCFEGTKKALIYEFMSNGSLDKFIYNKGPETIASLSWENLYQIAKGIARGLEYLHRGCTTRILHFDIKPHNILLDENLCPKISDFGLAKLCPKQESIISMSDQRGTMGYVAPEVWNRHFGGVSHKSDVYSYGMMLLEMVGGRKNIIADASHTSEIYFPHWVYNRLELGTNLRPDGVMDTEEDEIARRMTIVGLWCIQTFPSDRPTMSKVIEMLEVTMNSLEMPPKPLHSSPTRSVSESS